MRQSAESLKITGSKSQRASFRSLFIAVSYTHLDVYKRQVYDCLAGHRIYPRKYFYPLINDFQCYKGRFSSKDTPVAAYVADRVLTLPCYADLELEDVDRICGIIRGM